MKAQHMKKATPSATDIPQKLHRTRRGIRWLFFAFLALFLIAAVGLTMTLVRQHREQAAFAALVTMKDTVVQQAEPETPAAVPAPDENAQARTLAAALAAENPDCVGWLSIDGTAVDYPVMYTPDDPEYYLHRAFDGSHAASGVPFVGAGCTMQDNNLLLYGHNMKNGTMFADLTRYEDATFRQAHPEIELQTANGAAYYQIIAAFATRIYTEETPDVFRYYRFGGALDETQFTAYLAGLHAMDSRMSVNAAAYGDTLLTLSTCSYQTKDGRYVVVAKRLD